MKVLLVRANRNEVDQEALTQVGIESVSDPYLKITSVPNPDGALELLERLRAPEPKWLVITSQNAMEFWHKQLPHQALEQTLPTANAHYAALGATTKSHLIQLGAPAVITPDNNTSRTLADIISEGPAMPVLVPSGSISMKSIPETLVPRGFTVFEQVFYRTEQTEHPPPSAGRLKSWGITAVLLRSPSAARAFVEHNPSANNEISVICGGITTARHLMNLGWKPTLVSPDPEPTALARAVAQHFGVTYEP
jgi:uroporphyrinogen-III synthase